MTLKFSSASPLPLLIAVVVVVVVAFVVTKLTTKVIKDQTQVGAEAGLNSSPQARRHVMQGEVVVSVARVSEGDGRSQAQLARAHEGN